MTHLFMETWPSRARIFSPHEQIVLFLFFYVLLLVLAGLFFHEELYQFWRKYYGVWRYRRHAQ